MGKENQERLPLEEIVTPLLEWYQENARVLPWREQTDAYHIWISEIMLQQTRVEAVIPYYHCFLEALPTIEALANVSDDVLMKLWEGLGYYSRARNLKKAAGVIVEKHGGIFPAHYEDILTLPGIGPYTAGAIASIAFYQRRAAVDGNVLRVYTRLMEDATDISDMKWRKEVTRQLDAIYPKGHCAEFTQSLMELGAMVCIPNGEPKCAVCPIQGFCQAKKHGTQMQYPYKAPKQARRIEQRAVFYLMCNNRIAIRKRASTGLLAGLWELPNITGDLSVQEACDYLAQIGVVIDTGKGIIKESQKKHIFTHIEWHMALFRMECKLESSFPDDWIWVEVEELAAKYALPTAFRKLL